MARQGLCQIILIVFLCIVLLIAWATKAAHWDKIIYKGAAKDNLNEVYPGLEGMIATDVILMVFFIVGAVLTCKKNAQVTKILCILIVIMLVIRIILALLFLAGNNEYGRKTIDACKDLEDQPVYATYTLNYGNGNSYYGRFYNYCADDPYKTFKGAWVMEIIAFILVNILAPICLFMLFKGAK